MPAKLNAMVEEVLTAFIVLFTQPFEQDMAASKRAAALSISLGGLGRLGDLRKGRMVYGVRVRWVGSRIGAGLDGSDGGDHQDG